LVTLTDLLTPAGALLAYLLFASGFTMLVFGLDKRRALRAGWRIPERVLLFLALLGGAPGAKLGQWVFRHKTRGRWFGGVLNAVVLVQIGVLVAVTVPADKLSAEGLREGAAKAAALFAPQGPAPQKTLPRRFGPGSDVNSN
jgi:uncharacterized membrane protein YsdA (DUF1294 family)